jgi:hypothetical protein
LLTAIREINGGGRVSSLDGHLVPRLTHADRKPNRAAKQGTASPDAHRLSRAREAGAPQSETALTLELENANRVAALPGKEGSIRSYSSVDLILIDEATRMEDST